MPMRTGSRRPLARVAALAAALLWLAPAPAIAQSEPIERVIGEQIEAFLADDFEAAFGYASPGIRSMFGDPQNFGRMVRRGYPMIWRPDSFRFEDLETVDGRLRQSVSILDRQGRAWVADYYMVKVGDDWRIDGVTLREAGLSS